MSTTLAKKIVDAVEREINGRSGIGWDGCDRAVKKEIRQILEKKVDNILKKAAKTNET